MNFDLLKKISETPGAPGFEYPIRNIVKEEVKGLVDESFTDNLGNFIVTKKGTNNPEGKSVAIAAHLDEIGFIVTHIDDNGFVRFHTLGGFDPKTLTSLRVWVHGKESLPGVMGCKPIHIMSAEERGKAMKTTDYFIDLGLPAEKVKELISIGSPVTRYQDLIQMGDTVTGKSLDNRVSVYILIETLKRIKNAPYDILGMFTVQEEVGIRGANVATHSLNPDFGICLDVTIANDTPGAQPADYCTQLGKGTAIKILDGRTICDYRMTEYMTNLAEANKIAYQKEILPFGGTDTAGLQQMGKNGAIAGAISIPLRYMHQTTETVHNDDIEATIQLLVKCLENLNQFDWSHK